jgi:hypothetical protein
MGVASEVVLWPSVRIEQEGPWLWFGTNVACVEPVSAILFVPFVFQFFVIRETARNEPFTGSTSSA